MLDEGAKAWLATIEAKKTELDQLMPELTREAKRNGRLTGAKARQASDTIMQGLEAQKNSCEAFIETETALFYREVFGIKLYQLVAVRDRAGALSATLCATQLIARQLANGFGVFTITGDSMVKDLHQGLPACEFLMAQEANDDWLVAVA